MAASAVASEHSFMTGGSSGNSVSVSVMEPESDDEHDDHHEQLLPAPLSWFEQSNMTEEEASALSSSSSPLSLKQSAAASASLSPTSSSSTRLENAILANVHSVTDTSQREMPPVSLASSPPPFHHHQQQQSQHQQQQHSLLPVTTGIFDQTRQTVVQYQQEDDDDDEEVDRLKRIITIPHSSNNNNNMSISSSQTAAAAVAAAAADYNAALMRPHTLPSPSWKEISLQILPAAARELWSNSMNQLVHTAQLSYAQKSKWYRNYTDLGQDGASGYNYYSFIQNQQQPQNNNSNNSSSGDNNNSSNSGVVQLPAHLPELPPFSSLPWVDRQLVREWRTYLPDDDDDNNNHNHASNVNDNNGNNGDDNYVDDYFDIQDFDRARTLVPMTLPRPVWQKSEVCSTCRKTFGPARLRHHCRSCGYSFCQVHSSGTQKLAHLGYNPQVPERVCDACHDLLLEQHLAERVAWRLARCRDYNNNHNNNNGADNDASCSLSPYFETGVDTLEDVALRITNAALQMAKSIPLGAQATVAVETVNVLRKHGLTGIYTIMLRREFLAAADLLRKTLGINRTAWPLSVHELSAAIFYALAQHRAMRGMNPEREEWIHTIRGTTDFPPNLVVSAVLENGNNNDTNNQVGNHPGGSEGGGTSDAYNLEGAGVRISHLVSSNITTDTNTGPATTRVNEGSSATAQTSCKQETSLPSSFVPVCDVVPNATLESVIFYAPLALNFIYSPREVDMQLLAAQQGWRLLYAYLHQEVLQGQKASDRPASAVFIHEHRKVICLAIRGTTTINDVVTDMRQTPVPFPEKVHQHHEQGDWTTVSRGQGLAVSGMAGAAFNLYREHVDSMMLFSRQGYEVVLVGHSLGGGVATLLGVLFHGDMKKDFGHVDNDDDVDVPLHVYAYGTPCCIDSRLAECVDRFVTTVVLHDDVVPRLTPTSCRGLLKHLLHIRDTWVRHHLPDDLMAITERARTAWAPRWREGFTLSTSTYSIKRYCRKQLQYSRKQFLYVTDKLVGDAITPAQQSLTNKSKKSSHKGKIMEQGNLFAPPKESKAETTAANESIAEVGQGPHLLVDYMGGIDCRVEGVAIDGEEFFDTDENPVEEESEYDEFEDAVDDLDRLEEILPAGGGETKQASTSAERQRSTSSSSEGGDGASMDDDETPGAVVLSETPLPRLYTPGKIIHIYSHRGVYKAAYVPRTFRELRRISLAGNMLSDHKCKEYYEALLEVRSARAAPEGPPRWTAFDEDDTCSNCASRFTWASTCDSAAQAARDKHNCRSCGTLVCDPCSTNRIPLASLGLTVPVRVCDRCYNDIDGILTCPPVDNAGSLKHQRSTRNHDEPQQDNIFYDKPERRRERRSAVVDELASRIQASPLAAP